MNTAINLHALAQKLGPQIAQGVAGRDAAGTFVSENYNLMKEHKVFSALVPTELGGGGASYTGIVHAPASGRCGSC